MTQNPLTEIRFEIPFDQIRAEHVEPAIDELVKAAESAIESIAAETAPRTYANTLEALERATERLEYAMGIASHLESVATSPALREVYGRAQPKVSAFYSKIPLHQGLWDALSAYAKTSDAAALTGAKKRLLKKTLDDFRRHGAELDAAGKTRLSAIDVRLAELTTKFSQNVLDSTNAFELIIEDESRLAGLPPSAMEAAKDSAKQRGKAGYRFTLQAPSLTPVLMYLDDRAIREQIWRAYNTRATSGALDNGPLITEILRLRKEKAVLLGFKDFSDFVLADRMAKNGGAAQKFVETLWARTVPYFERENAALHAFKLAAEAGRGESEPLMPWDVGYWSEKERRSLYDFDEEVVRPYFAADRVLAGVFETATRLYGVRILPTSLPGWDASVQTYKLVDSGGEHLGSFYVDLYPRDNKRGGAWMNALVTGLPPSPHLGLFCLNANPPIGGKPALLTHGEVETVFHEFGHLLHHLLSDVPVRSLAGTNVAWDFVELPSQIMENWCWEKSALDAFAKHIETNETIPDDLFSRMDRARNYRAANGQMRQLSFAALDLALHRDYDEAKDGPVLAYARKIMARAAVAPLPDDYAMLAGFTHLFADSVGYAAGYYSYKWAEVLDADAFSRFQKEGVFSEEVGRDFRAKVLSRGNAEDPAALFRDFMGRDATLEPLMERQGLV
jgi:oligopeptidase A